MKLEFEANGSQVEILAIGGKTCIGLTDLLCSVTRDTVPVNIAGILYRINERLGTKVPTFWLNHKKYIDINRAIDILDNMFINTTLEIVNMIFELSEFIGMRRTYEL